jgi:hypothetical protein
LIYNAVCIGYDATAHVPTGHKDLQRQAEPFIPFEATAFIAPFFYDAVFLKNANIALWQK